MQPGTRMWLHGLFAALIGGGASSVSAGFANCIVDPKDFNAGGGLAHLGETMVVTFVVSGALSAFAYLKQSPLPPEPGDTLKGV
jgi:hypothetical protein